MVFGVVKFPCNLAASFVFYIFAVLQAQKQKRMEQSESMNHGT